MKRLYLVRHGETDANRLGIIEGYNISGFPESDLNYHGTIQSLKIAHALKYVRISHLYMSPSLRAIKTAEQICLWTNSDYMPIKKSIGVDLTEVNFGLIEGLKASEANEKYRDLYETYYKNPSQAIFPDGESIAGAFHRVGRVIDRILSVHRDSDENILIVSHGGPMALIFIHIFQMNLDKMFHAIRHNNCGLSIIEWGNRPIDPKIICLNDISHLKDEQAERLKAPLPYFESK